MNQMDTRTVDCEKFYFHVEVSCSIDCGLNEMRSHAFIPHKVQNVSL